MKALCNMLGPHKKVGEPLQYGSEEGVEIVGYPPTMILPILPLDVTIYLRYHGHVLGSVLSPVDQNI